MAKSNVVLINPPNPRNLIADRDAAGGFGVLRTKEQIAFPPLSLLYSAAVLEKRNHSVRLIDCSASNYDEKKAIKRCLSFDPDVVTVLTSTQTFRLDCGFAKRLKEENEEITSIMIGPIVRLFPMEALSWSSADFGVLGEPEYVLSNLTDSLFTRTRATSVKGVLFRRKKEVVSTGDAPLIENLDGLPYPAWHLLSHKRFFFTISSSRGCPYNCFYCPYVVSQGVRYRFRSPGNVVKEIQYLKDCFDAKLIQFRDPTFSFLKQRAKGICELLIQRKIDINWIIETRPENLDSELLNLLAKAGCSEILMGVESGSERILRSMDRLIINFSAENYLNHIRKIVRQARELGIVPFTFFMLGLPEEDLESSQTTIRFAKELGTPVQFSVASPYPGTKLYEMAKQEGLLCDDDFSKMDTYTVPLVRTRYLASGELENVVKRANYETRAQKGLETLSRSDLRFFPMHLLHLLRVEDKVGFARKGMHVLTSLLKRKNRG